MGLNIKGQLGHSDFQNRSKPKLVVSLLPHGLRNPKSLNPSLTKTAKPPIVEILESTQHLLSCLEFELQVKIEEEPI